MNKKLLTFSIAILMVALVAATSALFLFPYSPDKPPVAIDTDSTQAGIQELANANNEFAFDLYSKLDQSNQKNIFYSPYSISAALAMTYEGANGQTADEMKAVFHFPDDNILRPNFAAIYNNLNTKNSAYELKTGNALWIQDKFPLLTDYTNIVENFYGGKAANLNFISESEKSRQTINTFIEEQTNNKIKDVIPKGFIGSATRLIITNAIYFKGTWEWEFDKSDTQEQDFEITPNNSVKTQMMFMDPDKARFNYASLEKLQIIELPYKGEEISMLILLPKQGEEYNYETDELIKFNYTLDDIELSFEKFNEYKAQMKKTKLDSISLPKFEFDSKYFMKDTLASLGMPTAFSDAADFSGMTGGKDLLIGSVIHQAYIKVDEKGTEAAAATTVGMVMTSMTPTNVFRANHPFIFIIQEQDTGNILFMGKVSNPNK